MLAILSVTAPIFVLMAIGYLAVRSGLLSKTDNQALGRFVLYFCIPALLFRAFAQRRLGEVFDASYLVAYGAGSMAAFVTVLLLARLWRGNVKAMSGMQAMGACSSNSAFIGYPIAVQVFGPVAGVALALCTLIENLITIPWGLAYAEGGSGNTQRWQQALLQSLRGLARNPMIYGISAGIVFSALSIPLPSFASSTLGLLATASSPVALFVIGGSLVGLQLDGQRTDIAIVVAGKLLLHPLAVAGTLLLLPATDPLLAKAAVLYAAVPMLSIYAVLAQRHGQQGFCAATLLATTVASFATITAWLWWLDAAPLR